MPRQARELSPESQIRKQKKDAKAQKLKAVAARRKATCAPKQPAAGDWQCDPSRVGFLSLPAELRVVIYELCLVDPNEVFLTSWKDGGRRAVRRGGEINEKAHRQISRMLKDVEPSLDAEPAEPTSAILAVSKVVRDEAAAVLYGQRILLDTAHTIITFLGHIGQYNSLRLRNVVLLKWEHEPRGREMLHAAMSMLSYCISLEAITLGVSCGYKPAEMLTKFLEDCHQLYDAIGRAKGRKDAAMDIVTIRPYVWLEPENVFEDGVYAGRRLVIRHEMYQGFWKKFNQLLTEELNRPRWPEPDA